MTQRLTKSMRLRRRTEFVHVQSTGRKVHGRHFVALVAPSTASPLECGRVGFTVTKRIGNAVTRNRIKRSAREWLRQHGWVPTGQDVVFIAKETAAASPTGDLGADLGRIVARVAAR
jgi:ribonuclease P protein component